ncbi:MAG: methanogenesis marker 2 protein [Candidatus Syntropharchaeia archaeon]
MDIERLATALRNFKGVTRKRAIKNLMEFFNKEINKYGEVIASFGEDAAVIDWNDKVLLFAADGIWEVLMEADPRWAGYCAVLVNVQDIVAMGGTPIAMVDVFSTGSGAICSSVSQGISEGIEKFDVPLVGGHIHPDSTHSCIGIAILGTAKRDAVIYSSTATPKNDIIVAIDLDGKIHPSSNLNWDSTTFKDKETIKTQLQSMREIGESHLVTAGKDISNPGMIGTLGMLLETSRCGAVVDIKEIPKPEEVDMEQWLKVYPGMGFILTSDPENTEEVISIFKKHKLTAVKIGETIEKPVLRITDGENHAEVFDFERDYITGIRPKA